MYIVCVHSESDSKKLKMNSLLEVQFVPILIGSQWVNDLVFLKNYFTSTAVVYVKSKFPCS